MSNWNIGTDTFTKARDAAAAKLAGISQSSQSLVESGRETYNNMTQSRESLKIYKMYPEAHLPVYGTDWAACFDLKASITKGYMITSYTSMNSKTSAVAHSDDQGLVFVLQPHTRSMIPTGLIFDLTERQSLRIHPRSGLAVKHGIILANCEGVVDGDYVDPSFITAYNTSDVPFEIRDGMRIAQAEIVANNPVEFEVVEDRPLVKTNRSGGFGSTGQ